MREGKDPLDARHQEEDVEITTTRANPIDDKLSFGINNSSWLSSILCSHVLSLHYFTHHRAPQQQPIKYPTHVDPHPKSSHSVFLTRLIQPHLILTKRQKILPRINGLHAGIKAQRNQDDKTIILKLTLHHKNNSHSHFCLNTPALDPKDT